MEATDDLPTYFYVHTVAVTDTGRLMLLAPERVELPGDAVKQRQHFPTNSGY
jgi:hypothetical protein